MNISDPNTRVPYLFFIQHIFPNYWPYIWFAIFQFLFPWNIQYGTASIRSFYRTYNNNIKNVFNKNSLTYLDGRCRTPICGSNVVSFLIRIWTQNLDQDPHQKKSRIRIRIKVKRRIRICVRSWKIPCIWQHMTGMTGQPCQDSQTSRLWKTAITRQQWQKIYKNTTMKNSHDRTATTGESRQDSQYKMALKGQPE